MKLERLRVLLAISAQLNLKVRQYDVKAAYLNADLKEELYMEQPEGFAEPNSENEICKLLKSLYGLPQAGRYWNLKLNDVLVNIGLTRLKSDPCVYMTRQNGKLFMLGVYVDDNLAAGTDDAVIDSIMSKVKDQFEMTEVQGTGVFLGMEIAETMDGFEISQRNYTKKILTKYGMEVCNASKTPGDPKQNLDNNGASDSVDIAIYQEMLGSLMYLSVGTRPDITYSVSFLSQYSQAPKQIHMIAIKRVFRYLQGTRDYCLKYDRQKGGLKTTTDASWSSTADAKSFSGFSLKIGNALINWKTRKQHVVALSTFEAELMALCEGLRDLQWTVGLITELMGDEYMKPPFILQTDSKSVIDWVKGSGNSSRTKHIARRYHYVRDEVTRGNVNLSFIKSEELEADALTKFLTQEKLMKCNVKFGLVKQDPKLYDLAQAQKGDCCREMGLMRHARSHLEERD